jgi:hypothetical protein
MVYVQLRTPPWDGVVWDLGHGLLPTKTSRFAFLLVEGSLSALMVGKLGCVPGVCASDGWWLYLVVFGCVWYCVCTKPRGCFFFFFLQVGAVCS